MRAGPIVIFHVTEQQVTEVALAEYNNVVKAFPADRTDQPFSIPILPRGARWSGRYPRSVAAAAPIAFPGEFDDQVDAMTQYLDFMETDPIIPAPRAREPLIARVNASTVRWRRR
jgi:hypothetical protein